MFFGRHSSVHVFGQNLGKSGSIRQSRRGAHFIWDRFQENHLIRGREGLDSSRPGVDEGEVTICVPIDLSEPSVSQVPFKRPKASGNTFFPVDGWRSK